MKVLFRYVIVLFSLLIFSCRKDVGKVKYGNYPPEIGLIINHQCATAGCHNSYSYKAANGLNLDSWPNMFRGSGSGSPVIPYSSRFSSLCYFINTYSELGLQNKPTMPLNSKPLAATDVKKIMDWIDNGAPDADGQVMWAGNPKRKKLYAVNQGCDVVTVFDAETQLPMRFIPVGTKLGGNTPHMVRVSPDGEYWYVIFVNNNIMQKYRCSDDAFVGNIPMSPLAAGTGSGNAQDWNTFVITKDGKRAYCVSWTQSGKINCVDLENMKLLHYLGGQAYPHGIVLNAAEDTLYVAAQTGNYMTEIDTGFTSANPIVLESGAQKFVSSLDPHDLVLAPNNNDILITCQQSNEVRVYHIPSGTVTAVIPTGVYPQEIIYVKSTNQYFVSCTEDVTTFPGSHGLITRIEANGYAATKLKCGFQPHGIAADETRNLLYVLSRNIVANGPAPHHTSQCQGRNGFINFIDLNTFLLLPKRYELSVDPYFIYARP